MTTDPPDRELPADAGTASAGEAKAPPLDDVVASLIDEKPARPRLSVVPPPAEGAAAADAAEDGEAAEEPEAPLPPGAVKVDLGKLLDLGGLSGGLRELAGWIEKQVPQLNAAVSKFLSSVEVVLTSNDAFPVPGVSEAERAEATKGAQASSPLSVVPDEPGPGAPVPDAPVEEPDPNPQPTPDPNPGPDPAPVRDPEPVPDPNPGNDPLPIHDPPPPLQDDPGRDPLPIGDPIGDPAPMGDPVIIGEDKQTDDGDPDPIATD